MKISMPQAQSRAVEEAMGGFVFVRDWIKFLRNLWAGAGFDHKTPMYGGIWVPGTSLWFPSVVGAETEVNVSGGIWQKAFGIGQDLSGMFSFNIPNDYRDGTSISPYVVWTADGNPGNVKFSLEVEIVIESDVFSAPTTIAITPETPSVANMHVRSLFADISGLGLAKGDQVIGRLRRQGDTDGVLASVPVFGVGFKYQREGVGHEKVHP